MRNQRNVRWRHRIVAQSVSTNPSELLSLTRDHVAFPAPADIKRHQEMEIGIGVARESERSKTGFPHGDTDFLVQFASKRGLRPLAGLELAARKFPKPGKCLSFRPLRDQH